MSFRGGLNLPSRRRHPASRAMPLISSKTKGGGQSNLPISPSVNQKNGAVSTRAIFNFSAFPPSTAALCFAAKPIALPLPNNRGTPIRRPWSSEHTNPWRRQPPVFNLFIHRLQLPITPVSSNHGCDESRQTPIRIKRASIIRRSPWRLRRPRKTLVPRRVQ
jgi:hypothetical protein